MMLDNYKRNYKFKSRQSGASQKVLWITLIITAIIVAVIYFM